MAVIKPDPDSVDAIAIGKDLEIEHLMETTGLSRKRAEALIERFGGDWERIRLEAENYKAK